jgi:hypothetical protein
MVSRTFMGHGEEEILLEYAIKLLFSSRHAINDNLPQQSSTKTQQPSSIISL